MHQNQAPPGGSALPNTGQAILFVSGKGGVGKSLVAAGIATEAAKSGRRVLLAEIGDQSYYKDFFGLPRVGHEPSRTQFGFDLALWSGETCLKEYVLYFLKLQRLYSIFFENKVMRALINVAPGLNEIAILGKITSGVRKVGPPLEYDLIVVDSYATGHALALLLAPRGLMEAIGFGPMGTHSREMDAVVRDPKICGYATVTLLEDMPVTETLEFREQLKRALGVDTSVVVNKVLETPVTDDELGTLASADPRGLGEFASYLLTIHRRQTELFGRLRSAFESVHEVPLIFSNDASALVEKVGEVLRRA